MSSDIFKNVWLEQRFRLGHLGSHLLFFVSFQTSHSSGSFSTQSLGGAEKTPDWFSTFPSCHALVFLWWCTVVSSVPGHMLHCSAHFFFSPVSFPTNPDDALLQWNPGTKMYAIQLALCMMWYCHLTSGEKRASIFFFYPLLRRHYPHNYTVPRLC